MQRIDFFYNQRIIHLCKVKFNKFPKDILNYLRHIQHKLPFGCLHNIRQQRVIVGTMLQAHCAGRHKSNIRLSKEPDISDADKLC